MKQNRVQQLIKWTEFKLNKIKWYLGEYKIKLSIEIKLYNTYIKKDNYKKKWYI